MGFFSNLRAASTVGTAKQFVQKYLEVENVLGMVKASPKELAEKLVLAVWADLPELAQGQEKCTPVLLAAAAYANGIKHFDATENKRLADALFRCHSMLMQYDVAKLVEVGMQRGVDKKLADMAYAVFDK